MNILSLDGDMWSLRRAGQPDVLPARVPGSVLADLLAAGQIPDPFRECNEFRIQDVFRQDYQYERTFTAGPEMIAADFAQMIFYGLDTLADVYLNDAKILSAEDMHRTYRVDVRPLLQPGVNRLKVYFHSAMDCAERMDKAGDITYASTGCMHGNWALRKAHYMFGWDWGPRLPDSGIWRSVEIRYGSGAMLGDVRIHQNHEKGLVTVTVDAALSMCRPGEYVVECRLFSPDGILLQTGSGQDVQNRFVFPIARPALWWPNGCGGQPLYRIQIRLRDGGALREEKSWSVGLRTLTVSTAPDQWGSELAFVVNGVKLFAMGANYIPQDNILRRVTPQRTKKLLHDCARANFNCVRVWGGGYYPDDSFYDLCDRYGLIVWQDLMFACNVYPLDDRFERNVRAETLDNVARIRHHACLGLWCGNNEMEWGWSDWDRLKGHRLKYKADYLKIFEMILPRALRQADDTTFYWPSSPSSGGSFENPNDFNRGDNHYWEVWHSNKPFTEYRRYHFRFCSEFGFQSFPSIRTIRSFCPPEEENIFSAVMEAHQKNGQANGKILSYIAGYFRYPAGLENVAYVSQILQLKAIQYGVEHWRRNRGRCMGAIYWQLNDCWPVASWASIDYYGRWKALHYGAKRFYQPFMASACEETELSTRIAYYLHNDTLRVRHARLRVRLIVSDFSVLRENICEAQIAPMTVQKAWETDFSRWLPQEQRDRAAAVYELEEDGRVVSRGTTLFVKPKHFHYAEPHIRAHVAETADGYTISLTADSFAQYVELSFASADGIFSDNYFDMTSSEPREIGLLKSDFSHPEWDAARLLQDLRIKSVADSY